ncbi:MAG: hypothetical protein D6730_05180, partial [Bacteroidetes bacterium]
MHLHLPKPMLVYVTCLLLCTAAGAQTPPRNYLFDMGPIGGSLEPGFLEVSDLQSYRPEYGYGWLQAPEKSFTQAGRILPENPRVLDGVWTSGRMRFRIDAPPGDYFLTLTLGYAGHDTATTRVLANGQVLLDSLQTPWRRLPYRHHRQPISLQQGFLELEFQALEKGAALQSVELRPRHPLDPTPFQTTLEADTAVVGAYLRQLRQQLRSQPGDFALQNRIHTCQQYLQAAWYYDIGWWSWAVEATGMSIFPRFHAASDLLQQILADPADPLYERAAYLLGKIHYWLYQEQEYEEDLRLYPKFFNLIASRYPQHQLLRMYMGEKIYHHLHCPMPPEGQAPEWARLQHEAMCRMLEIIHWWVDERQAENGELGGKLGDDVEILRWWLPAILGADDAKARLGYTRLANGVWNSGLLENGYSKKIEDVEHAAELFRDSHPVMLLLNYGDPRFVERCLISMQNFDRVWTGINPQGQRLFRSSYFSATEVVDQAPYNVDVAMNARATLAGLWAAWYNHNPTLLRLFSEWGHSWVKAARSTAKGKPAGLLPAAIGFYGEIGGHSTNWYHPRLGWTYYNWERMGSVNEMYIQLLGMYALTGDTSFLYPARATLSLALNTPVPARTEEIVQGSAAWAAYHLRGGAAPPEAGNGIGMAGLAKSITGNKDYDDFLLRYGSPYSRYRITGDKAFILQGCKQLLASLRYNFPLKTSEVKFTDRVYVDMDELLSGMYTGHIGSGFEFPALAVSWAHTGKEVAVLVNDCSTTQLNISLYNFGQQRQTGMYAWQLAAGRYEVVLGIDQNDDGLIEQQVFSREWKVEQRGQQLLFDLPAATPCLLKVRQLEALPPLPAALPDLAFSEEDLRIEGSLLHGHQTTIHARIHNIGNLAASNVKVQFWMDDKKIAEKKIARLQAPNDLSPRW